MTKAQNKCCKNKGRKAEGHHRKNLLSYAKAKSCWSFQEKRCRRWTAGAELEAKKSNEDIQVGKQRVDRKEAARSGILETQLTRRDDLV